jgi:dihydrofolate reductase
MRKIIYLLNVSLDGFIETPDRKTDWAIIDEAFHTFAYQQTRQMGVFLYGRRMYELMAADWPRVAADPSAPAYMAEFARMWKDKPKVVFSKTLDKVAWNSRLVRENIPEAVAALKAQPGGDMSVGGAGLAASFMRLGLIDGFRLFIHPVVLGNGTPFFPTLAERIDLRLVDTRTFDTGVVYLSYLRTGQE